MELSQKLKHRMKELGLSQRELAKRAGITQQTISKYITGQGLPAYRTILALSRALQVPPIWFFEDIDLEWFSQYGIQLMRGTTVPTAERRPPHEPITHPQRLAIGHWFPMRRIPSPLQGNAPGFVTYVYALLFNRLMRHHGGRVYDELAIDWKPMSDGWLFQLRNGVLFHDDTPLTAEDVRWSYAEYLRQNPAERAIQGVQVIDGGTVLIRTHEPMPLVRLAMPPILPMGSREEMVGTGPFQLVERQPALWRFHANPYYFRGRPYLEEVLVIEYDNRPALEQALLAGEVDYALGVYVPGEGLRAEVEPSSQRYQLHFLLDEPPVQDVNVRRAIALGLDRAALAKAVGLKSPLYSAGAFDRFLHDASDEPPEPDVVKAQSLLSKVPKVRGISLRVAYAFALEKERALAEELVRQLRELGLTAELGEPGHLFLTTRDVDDDVVLELRHWLSGDRLNLSGYRNPAVDEQIQALLHLSPTLEQLRSLRRLIQQDVPAIPLFYGEMEVSYVARLRVKGGGRPMLSRPFEFHNWYLEVEAEES